MQGDGTHWARTVALPSSTRSAPVAFTTSSEFPLFAITQIFPSASTGEAMAMAVLGVLSRDRVPITLPGVTGVPHPAPVAGVWTGG